MELPTNSKIDKILDCPNPDGKNFTTILTSLDLLKKGDRVGAPRKVMNRDYTGKNNRYKKTLPEPQTKESESDPNYSLKKYTKELLKRTINTGEFREVLRQHNINPNIEGVNIYITIDK